MTIKNIPQRLIFERINILSFPKDKKAVVYFCPQINQYHVLSDTTIKEETFIDRLSNIVEVESVIFRNGSTLDIDSECSDLIVNLYEEVDEKEKFTDYIFESSENFLKILGFAAEKDA